MPQYTNTLIQECSIQENYLEGEQINTIYLGGGTPSLFGSTELNTILDAVFEQFDVSDEAEITVEANPDDVRTDWIEGIRQTNINRISLGVQSFFDEDLAYLNRVHTASDADYAIKQLQDAGFDNMTIDLIYGIPTLSDEKWEKNLRKFFDYNLPHLSAYALTVEEKTALRILIDKEKIAPPKDSAMVEQFKILLSMTEEQEFIHYEISNFAREGFYSKHNSLYWTGGHYLGLGPSAHSYNGRSRRWNKPSMKAWLGLNEYYSESYEEEILTTDQRFNEYVMTSLRTVWGCDIAVVRLEFGEDYASGLLSRSDKFIADQSIIYKGSRLFLTRKGKLFADGIASELFS